MGVHIIIEEGKEHDCAIKLAFKTTNNKTEYEALFLGMTITRSLGAEEVQFRANSKVVFSQVKGEFMAKSERLKKYLAIGAGRACLFSIFLDLANP